MNNEKEFRVQLEILQRKTADLENKLKETEESLKVSQRRYEIAMSFSDVTIFDYNIKTKKILTQPEDFETFGMPGILEDGIEEILSSGIIAERSKEDLRNLYKSIDEGASTATTIIYANDLNGSEKTLELQMVSIFDQEGNPTYAVGVRKDITEMVRLHKEKEYGALMSSEMTFIYEANVTQDKLLRYDMQWAQDVNLEGIKTLTGVLQLMCNKYIAPEHTKLFAEKQSPSSVLNAFNKGERIITFEYRKLLGEKGYQWFEAKINLIVDEITKDINMRVYNLNIDNRKKLDIKSAADRKRYELTLSKSIIVYELNITKNTMNYLHEELDNKYELFAGENFTQNVLPLILKSTHPHDTEEVAKLLSIDNLVKAYTEGKDDLICEYRRMDKKGRYNWFRCSLQIFADQQTNDIMCYAYIEDINEEKEKETELLYKAQHDLMTGFYNKNSSAEKVDEILSSEEGKAGTHIFFIIDLDHFKLVNDKFGHAFGDAVLSQTSAKISALFRNGDVLGRIGGDEFIVFMSNVQNDKIACLKAQEICEHATEVYAQDGIEYKVTVSVGIAIYDKHGKCYDELYRNSDVALYVAKEKGRNQFYIYNEDMKFKRSAVNGIDPRQVLETNTFERNIGDYIFRILYEAKDKRQAINSVLELIGKHYHVSRVYVFENSEDGRYACNTFEWCSKGIASQMELMMKIPYSLLGNYKANFNSEGIFYVADTGKMTSQVKRILIKQNVKSMVQFSFLENGKFAGFIGFDECNCYRVPENKELNDYRNFANVLGVFIAEMRAFDRVEAAKNSALSVVNGLDAYAYVCDPYKHKILFANVKTTEFSPKAVPGACCYEALWNKDKPCQHCPMEELIKSGKEKFVKISYKPTMNQWLKITTSWVNWLGDKKGCLINALDITEFKQNDNN